MKRLSSKARVEAFTLIELLVVVVIIAVIAAMLLPARTGRGPNNRIRCVNNLKQIDIGCIMWATDHEDKFPWQISVVTNGTMEFISSGYASLQFRPVSEYMHNSQIFICPADKTKYAATNHNQVREENVSYFVNCDASTSNKPTTTILAGDRNLQANGHAVNPGLFVLTTNLDLSWTHELHLNGGNLAFADGHVEWTRTNNLNAVVQHQPFIISRLLVP